MNSKSENIVVNVVFLIHLFFVLIFYFTVVYVYAAIHDTCRGLQDFCYFCLFSRLYRFYFVHFSINYNKKKTVPYKKNIASI